MSPGGFGTASEGHDMVDVATTPLDFLVEGGRAGRLARRGMQANPDKRRVRARAGHVALHEPLVALEKSVVWKGFGPYKY